ncbi:MAG: 50S ribosomal protein L21e [Methanocellales archaeon]|nr:50S ribosomal protein L21e [Methanocellales archaeon]
MPGSRRKTRHKLKKGVREKGLSTITRAIQEFKIGQRVHITIDPSVHDGIPHPSFHGRTAKVTGQRGRAYLLEVRDGNTFKELIVCPQHLKPQR